MAQTPVTREVGEAARKAALAVPGVAGLHGGRVGEVALLLPGERIEGIRLAHRGENGTGVEVHIAFDVSSDRDIPAVADEVREAVLTADEIDFVDVIVADAIDSSAGSSPEGAEADN